MILVSKHLILEVLSTFGITQETSIWHAVETVPCHKVRLAAAERQTIIRSYRIHRTRFEELGIDPRGIDDVIARVTSYPKKNLWLFAVDDSESAFTGFIDDDVTYVIATLAVPRRRDTRTQ